jgi:hypothetical protein
MDDGLKFILLIVLSLVLCLAGALAFEMFTEYQACNQITIEHQFNFWSGCMVRTSSNDWIPLDNYKYIEQEK